MSDCKDTCAFHNERDKLLNDVNREVNEHIGPVLNQHKAYWKFFFWAAGISVSIMMVLTMSIRASSIEIVKSVNKAEKNMSNQALRVGFIDMQLQETRQMQTAICTRVSSLEQDHGDR